MSNRTMSPSSFRPARRAKVPPIWPAPINAILVRAISLSCSCRLARAATRASLPCWLRGCKLVRCGKIEPVSASRLDQPRDIRLRGGTMRHGEIFGRTHLDEPRRGAFEFEGFAIAPPEIKILRLGRGRGDQLDVPVIKRVDQIDETLRLVALVRLDDRDVVEDDRVKGARERQEIGGAER